MKTPIKILLISALFIQASIAFALNTSEQRYANQLINGGAISIRDASKSIFHTGNTNKELLDVVAEVLLQNYHKKSNYDIDASAWAAKALGNSGNARYRATLTEVVKNAPHRKLKKHAKKALAQLSGGDAKQYKKGSMSLKSISKTEKKVAKTSSQNNGKNAPISEVVAGMSMQEVFSLCGQPSATTSYQTGKAFIPFNFKGGDSVRTAALYQGQGRIVFSNTSAYSSVSRVIEVLLDADESGYP